MDAQTIIFISALLSVVVLPTVAALYFNKATNIQVADGATTIQKIPKWSFANIYFWVLIVGVCGFGYLQIELWDLTKPKRHEGPELEFLSMSTYEKEIDMYAKQTTSPNWESNRNQLLLKFELAEYAWSKKDYVAVIDTLRELDSGKDDHGVLYKIPSYVVSNNLGCAFYKEFRNENFDAIRHLFNAKNRVAPTSPHQPKIVENIKRLDKLVNTLD